jgi:hypothetical protein
LEETCVSGGVGEEGTPKELPIIGRDARPRVAFLQALEEQRYEALVGRHVTDLIPDG